MKASNPFAKIIRGYRRFGFGGIIALCWANLINSLYSFMVSTLNSGHISIAQSANSIRYTSNNKMYRVIFRRNIQKPIVILNVVGTCEDDVEVDITELFMQCMGVYRDFHGIPTTPKMLGFDALKITTLAGTTEYEGEQTIIL